MISWGDRDTVRYEDLDNKSQRVNELFAFQKDGSLVLIPRVEFELRTEQKLVELAAPGWNVTQINFSIGVRGSILTPKFGKALLDLGVPASFHALIIRDCSRRTLEMHELLLKSYHCAKFSRPD